MMIGHNKEEARGKDLKKERKKRGNRKYGQAKLRHAKKGMYSLGMAILVIAIFDALILTAFLHKGGSPSIIGSFGLITIMMAILGIMTGIRGFRERDKNYITCKLGVGINVCVLISLIAIFIKGMV